MSRPGGERWVRTACAVLGVVLLGLIAGSCARPAASTAERARTGVAGPVLPAERLVNALSLVRQTPFVRAGGGFDLTVRVSPEEASGDIEIVASVFPAVPNRSEFFRALTEPPGRLPLVVTPPAVPDRDRQVSVNIPIQDPAGERDSERVRIGRRNGVHPVVVELRGRDAGPVRSRMVTFLTYLVEPDPTTPLLVSVVLAPGTVRPGAGPTTAAMSLTGLAMALESARPLPVTLAPEPHALDALAADPEAAEATVTRLRSALDQAELVAAPYVPVDLPALVARGLAAEIDHQLALGTETVSSMLGREPRTDTWVSEQSLDGSSIDDLARRGFRHVVLPERRFLPIDRQVTLTSPFLLQGTTVQLPALAGDDSLATHFGRGDQTLRAFQMMADLAVLFLDLPGSPRGAVALPPPDWAPNPAFFNVLRSGLTANPILRAAGLEELFEKLPPALVGRSTPLVRRVPPLASPAAGLNVATSDLLELRRRVDAMGAILPPESEQVARLDKLLLTAESSELADSRTAHLRSVRKAIARQAGEIRIPQNRSITLTARRGAIPVTFQNDTGLPATVNVKIDSDKLSFPGGATRSVPLGNRLNTTVHFPVVARTSGSFPVNITVQSPDGNLVVGKASLTVRSTAASGLGLVISVSAAAFLVVWWGRNAHRVRRAHTLVDDIAAAQAAATEELPVIDVTGDSRRITDVNGEPQRT